MASNHLPNSVAVKIMKKPMLKTDRHGKGEKWFNELMISHVNIVLSFGTCEIDGRDICLVMEKCRHEI